MCTRSQKFISFSKTILSAIALVTISISQQSCSGPPLKPWHSENLDEEFIQDKAEEVKTFADYLKLEDRLFKLLDEKVYAQSKMGPEYKLVYDLLETHTLEWVDSVNPIDK
jgi:hypothetical protein